MTRMMTIGGPPYPSVARGASGGPLTVSADVSRDEWDAYVNRHPLASGFHLWAWRKVFESAFDHRTEYLAARRSGSDPVGVLPLVVFDHWVFGRFMVSLPFVNRGGVLADDEEVARALMHEATERAKVYRCSHIELRHLTPQFADLGQSCRVVTLTQALAGHAGEAWDDLDRIIQTHVRTAERSRLTAELGGQELVPDFYAVFAEATRDRGAPVYPERWFAETINRFPGQSRVYVVRRGGEAVAGAVTFAFRAVVDILSAVSLGSHQSMHPDVLLHWQIVRAAIGDGARHLERGPLTPGDIADSIMVPWGATPREDAWERLRLSRRNVPGQQPRRTRLLSAVALWPGLPHRVANAIGPAVVRYLP